MFVKILKKNYQLKSDRVSQNKHFSSVFQPLTHLITGTVQSRISPYELKLTRVEPTFREISVLTNLKIYLKGLSTVCFDANCRYANFDISLLTVCPKFVKENYIN